MTNFWFWFALYASLGWFALLSVYAYFYARR